MIKFKQAIIIGADLIITMAPTGVTPLLSSLPPVAVIGGTVVVGVIAGLGAKSLLGFGLKKGKETWAKFKAAQEVKTTALNEQLNPDLLDQDKTNN